MKKYKHIIWDWNGTLFDDIDLCVENMNYFLSKYNYPKISIEKYREIFTFPVKRYYENLGMDFKKFSFEEIGKEWMDRYEVKKFQAKLFNDAEWALQYFSKNGLEQSVLSAYSQKNLEEILEYFNIKGYFKYILGLNDIYAHSKIELGEQLIQKIWHKENEILLIGDTLHDYEVANELKIDCVLVSTGHQSEERLMQSKVPIFNSLKELVFSIFDESNNKASNEGQIR